VPVRAGRRQQISKREADPLSLCSTMILASVLAAVGSYASAAAYSATATDSNPGSQAVPFRHLSKRASEHLRRGGALSGVAALELRLQPAFRR